MSDKTFIFVDLTNLQFFRSSSPDPVQGFKQFRCYKLACGDTDYQSFDNDRQDLIAAGWSEVPSPQFITINMHYMKESGKYYASGEIQVNRAEADKDPAKSWYDTIGRIRQMLDSAQLPGLVEGTQFEVFVSGEEHPGGYPQLFRIRK